VAPAPAGVPEPELAFVGGVEHDLAVETAPTVEDPSRFATVPVELGFHCERRGFADLLEGRMTLAMFRTAMHEHWWPDRLERVASAEDLATALERLEDSYPADPVGACRRLFLDLVAPVAEAAERPGVVEHSPGVLVNAPTLERMFAEARFVHVVRDGREVAAARLARLEGPPGERPPGAHAVLEGLEWWADELRRVDAGVRVEEDGATYGVWPHRLRVVLVPDPDRGGWERGLTAREQRRVRRRYRRILAELSERGVHCAPELIAAYES
jgi:Sulfotransferase family